jgi:hypothetical protein
MPAENAAMEKKVHRAMDPPTSPMRGQLKRPSAFALDWSRESAYLRIPIITATSRRCSSISTKPVLVYRKQSE